MRSAEGRQKVVQRRLTRKIDGREANGRVKPLRAEEIICANCQVEDVPRRSAWRIAIGVCGSGREYFDALRAVNGR